MTSRGDRWSRLTAVVTAGLSVTFFVGVSLSLGRAVTGDAGWLSQQPWSGVRVAVGVLFLLFALGRLVLALVGGLARRRSRQEPEP